VHRAHPPRRRLRGPVRRTPPRWPRPDPWGDWIAVRSVPAARRRSDL